VRHPAGHIRLFDGGLEPVAATRSILIGVEPGADGMAAVDAAAGAIFAWAACCVLKPEPATAASYGNEPCPPTEEDGGKARCA
jgi:hypothetical protein